MESQTIDSSKISRFEIEKIIFQCARQYLNKKHFSTDVIRHYIENEKSHDFLEKNILEIAEVLHSMIRASIFIPGNPLAYGSSDSCLPHLTITTYGKSIIEKEQAIPFDPDGFIENLISRIPNLDNIVLFYLSESIRAFNQHLLISTTLTLGIASERLVMLLSEVFISAQSERKKKGLLIKFEEKRIFEWHKILISELNQIKSQMPKELRQNLDVYLNQFFQFIRLNRNEKGHPSKLELSRNVVHGNLQIFVEYIEKYMPLSSILNRHPEGQG